MTAKVAPFQYLRKGSENMLDYTANKETIERITEINDKLVNGMENNELTGEEITRLMYEQLLRGIYLNQF